MLSSIMHCVIKSQSKSSLGYICGRPLHKNIEYTAYKIPFRSLLFGREKIADKISGNSQAFEGKGFHRFIRSHDILVLFPSEECQSESLTLLKKILSTTVFEETINRMSILMDVKLIQL